MALGRDRRGDTVAAASAPGTRPELSREAHSHDHCRMADEFMPIGRVASTYFVIAANAATPVNSIAELIAYAKARPGQILYGSTGQSSSTHLCMELFRTMTGIDLVHVPYKSAAMRLADLAGGQLQVSCAVAPSLQAFVKSGRVRALGVTAAQRTTLVPGVPSIAESVPGYEIVGWYGLLAPLGTPKAIVAQINSMVVKVLQTAEVQDRLIALGAEAAGSTPAEFGAFLRNQTSKWAKVLRESNIRPTE